jgi:hypothetical protein
MRRLRLAGLEIWWEYINAIVIGAAGGWLSRRPQLKVSWCEGASTLQLVYVLKCRRFGRLFGYGQRHSTDRSSRVVSTTLAWSEILAPFLWNWLRTEL